MENIILSSLTRENLVHEITTEVISGVKELLGQDKQEKKVDDYLTRKDVSKLLKISLVTVHEWSKKGILKPYKIGTRVRFKRFDVVTAITEMESKNW